MSTYIQVKIDALMAVNDSKSLIIGSVSVRKINRLDEFRHDPLLDRSRFIFKKWINISHTLLLFKRENPSLPDWKVRNDPLGFKPEQILIH